MSPDNRHPPSPASAPLTNPLLGQFFTPDHIVRIMCSLIQNRGSILEPSCGNGAFLRHLPNAIGIEMDATQAPIGARIMDFFQLPMGEKFSTIIGNPPYVRYQDIPSTTVAHIHNLNTNLNGRANLYLYFIEKCLHHLDQQGELIFITPRDFLKATSATPICKQLAEQGTITHFIDLGDSRIFSDATPNCAIWRFERNAAKQPTQYLSLSTQNYSHVFNSAASSAINLPWERRECIERGGHLSFPRHPFPVLMSELAMVKVGAVSGADDLYTSAEYGTLDFVCSRTVSDGQTRRMIWCAPNSPPPEILTPHKARLQARRIRSFNDNNWWQWGRGFYQSDRPRVYVNMKTRHKAPFFIHDCQNYDGSVLAIFPHKTTINTKAFAAALNQVPWDELGFICDGRHIFTQRSLEQTTLPEEFRAFCP